MRCASASGVHPFLLLWQQLRAQYLDLAMSTKVEVMEAALLDQRIRSDKHRENFEALKAVFINLQEVSAVLAAD